MADFLEAAMVICFGISWPINIMKTLRVKTAKGKSLAFLCFILSGYICGIASKLIAVQVSGKPLNYVFIFYIINFLMVSIDTCLYFRNRKIDKKAESAQHSII